MPEQGHFRKGQEVFVKRPVQIYANVIGPGGDAEAFAEGGIYCVRLQSLKQSYRSEDLEPSQRPEPIPTHRLDFVQRAREISDLIARRAYHLFESRGFTHGQDLEDWIRAKSEIQLNVPVDIRETETDFTIRAEVPGVSEENLEVQVAPRSVCILGIRQERSEENEGDNVYSERHCDRIFRVLDLPSEIDPDRVTATLSRGILEIKGLKQVPARARTASA